MTDSPATPEQHTELFTELGRCLYVYQAIEVRLKYLLPHLVVPGEEAPADNEGFANWRIYIDSKATLGPLIQRLKERVAAEEPAMIDAAWTQLVTYRNEVIHHFVEQPFARIASVEEFAKAMSFLQHRRKAALPLFSALQQLLTVFVDALGTTAVSD